MKKSIKPLLLRVVTKVLGDSEDFVVLKTLKGPAKGLKFRLNLLTRLTEPGYWFGTYDTEILSQLQSVIKPGWTVWDCGIYLGFYTNFFARAVGPEGKVIAYEPDPNNLERTKDNVKRNGFTNVEFVHTAIGAPIGETDFLLSPDTNSHLPGVYIGETVNDYEKHATKLTTRIKVNCMSLDQVLEKYPKAKPDLVKIDIEGAEKVALKHVERLASEVRPILALELHNPECDAVAWDFARRYNYSLRSLATGELIDTRDKVAESLLCIPAESGDSP